MTKQAFGLSFLILTALASFVAAQTPATATSADDAAILETFKAYNAAMASGDEATLLSLQHATTDGQKEMAKAVASNDLAVGKLKAAITLKFDAAAAKKVAAALGDIGDDDLVRAKIQHKGEQATVAINGGGIPMVKVDGKWLFDMSAPGVGGSADGVKAAVAQYETRVKKVNSVTAAVGEGKFETAEQIIEALGEM